MTKAEYVALVVAEFAAHGDVPDPELLKRAMGRAARNCKAKYGCVDWQSEMDENGIGNALWFYAEAAKDGGKPGASTFNRDRALRNR